MKIKTAWLSELRGSLGRPFLGGMNCFRTDKYGNIVGLKKPDPSRLFAGKRSLYQHQLRYWSLHWNFLTPGQKQAYQDLGDAEEITGYNYFMKLFYDIDNLYMAPTDNRWVELWAPNKNPTAEEYLHISDDEEYEDWIYINFPLEKISRNLVITKAELWLKYSGEAGWGAEGKRVDCYNILKTWSETSITYNNRPVANPEYTTWSLMPEEGEWLNFDVTEDIRKIIESGVLTFGWKLNFQETVTVEESNSGLRSTYPHDDDHWPFLKLIL